MRHDRWADIPDSQWTDWRWQLRNRIVDPAELESLLDLSDDERGGIAGRQQDFAFAITPYYLSLMGGPDCPVRRQAVPHIDECATDIGDMEDPLAEESHSPVEILSHRYPDRALLYVTHTCPVYCRHCTRQRKVGDVASAPDHHKLAQAFRYLEDHKEIRDVLVSGGDPLSLSDRKLGEILHSLRQIKHLDVVRLCTRNPVTLPQRITSDLVESLRQFSPLYLNTHFNHPKECTEEAALALGRLADAGIVLGNQMVLLRGVNDDADTVEELNRWLVRHRCRPYYMFQCDPVGGTAHLRTSIETGLEIVDKLRGRLSGLAMPNFAIDLPGGGGKITLSPDRLVRREGRNWVFRDYRHREFTYVDRQTVPDEDKLNRRGQRDRDDSDRSRVPVKNSELVDIRIRP